MAKVMYEVYEGDTKILEGSREYILSRFGLNKNGSLSSFINRGILLKKKYRVIKASNGKKESKLDYLVEHLSKYGNTVMLQDPTPFLDDLDKLGYKVIVKPFNLDTSNELLLNEESHNEYKKSNKHKNSRVISHYIEVI